MNKITIDILTEKPEIIRSLQQSRDSGTMIGITSPLLGPGSYITSVQEIIGLDESDPTIVIRGYDLSGYFLERNILKLSDITSVLPFNSLFENPFLKAMEKEMHHLKNAEENEHLRNVDYIF